MYVRLQHKVIGLFAFLDLVLLEVEGLRTVCTMETSSLIPGKEAVSVGVHVSCIS